MRGAAQSEIYQRQSLDSQIPDRAGRARTDGAKAQQIHEYRSATAAQVDLQRLTVPVNRPFESILTYLLSLRRYLEAKEAAKLIGCHRETFYLLISAGLPAQKRGRRWRIDPIAFAHWLEQRGFAPATTPREQRP